MTSFRIIQHPSGKALLYRNSSFLTLHVTIDQDDSFEEWKDSFKGSKHSVEEPKRSIEEWKDSAQEWNHPVEEPKDSFERSKHSSEEWKDAIEEPKHSAQEPKHPGEKCKQNVKGWNYSVKIRIKDEVVYCEIASCLAMTVEAKICNAKPPLLSAERQKN